MIRSDFDPVQGFVEKPGPAAAPAQPLPSVLPTQGGMNNRPFSGRLAPHGFPHAVDS